MENDSSQSRSPAVVQPLAMGELEGVRPPGVSAPVVSAAQLANPLRNVRVKLTICVGTAEVTVGELLGAKAHHVVKLDSAVDQPVDVLLDGQVVARGTLVAVEDRFGVRITELPVSLDMPLAGPQRE